MKSVSAERQLAGFIARYTPEIQALAQEALAIMRKRLPGAVELVYDNYGGLVIAFGSTERAADASFSIVLYPRWVTLFFLSGASLPDPQKILKGEGKFVRHMVLKEAADLNKPAVRTLMKLELKRAEKPIDATSPRRIVIKAIVAKQRPRRPR